MRRHHQAVLAGEQQNLVVAGFNRSVGSFIQFGKDATVNNLPAGSFTAEGYFYQDAAADTAVLFFGKNYMVDNGWGLKLDINHQFWPVANFQITDAQKVTMPVNIYGALRHIAFVYDNATRTTRMYIDGAEPAYDNARTQIGDGLNYDDSAVNGMIGSGLDGTVYNFPGMIGWIRISNIVRYTDTFTPPSLFSPPPPDANTLRLFKNNEARGIVITDYSPNALNGTFTYGDWIELNSNGSVNRTLTFTLSGTITELGVPVEGVTLTLGELTTTTDANSNYSFSGLSLANAGTLTPTKTNYTFLPTSISIPYIMDNLTHDFTGEVVITVPAVVHNGTTTRIALASEASLDNVQSGDITVEGYFNSSSAAIALTTMIDKGGWGGAGWFFGFNTTGLYVAIFCATTAAESERAKVLNDNIWHHIAMTYSNAGDRKIRIFLDGSEPGSYVRQVAGVGAIVSDAATNCFIGAAYGGYGFFTGKGGWARISNSIRYTSPFTPISRLYPPANDANTIRLFKMDEGTGTTITDSSSNAQNGTLANGSWVTE